MSKRKTEKEEKNFHYQQLKTFVNDKIISQNDPEKMDKIYDRTKELLWTGSKQLYSNNKSCNNNDYNEYLNQKNYSLDNNNNLTNNNGFCYNANKKNKKIQTRISSKHGQICISKEPIVSSNHVNHHSEDSPFQICQSCKQPITSYPSFLHFEHPSPSQQSSSPLPSTSSFSLSSSSQPPPSSSHFPLPVCYWCGRSQCMKCLQKCFNCFHYFCHLCSIIDYNETNEKTICLQCAEG